VLGACVLAGCASQSASPSVRVSNWVSDVSGGAAIGTLKVDSANVDLALAHHEPPAAIRTVCALLTNDAETAIGNLPAPDDQLTTDLDNAYEKAAAAGDDCYAGAGGESRLLRRSATERSALLPLLTTAVDRIEAITGRTPSTSTTAPTGGCSDPFGNCT
jgi:outer membrane murein-binding lipoprotein Lpp